MCKIAIIITITWFAVMLPTHLTAAASCTPFECYQNALEQLQYARELVETQQTEHRKLMEKVQQLAEANQDLIMQNQNLLMQHQTILSLLQQKIALVTANENKIGIGNLKPQAKLDVNGTVKAQIFQSKVKEFSSYFTVEQDSADKDFYENETCIFGSITAALVTNPNGSNQQASICTCLKSKRGRGWFCWN